MGRKSAKGKEKKLKRKEEQAKMAISMAVVEAAEKLEDPMVTLAQGFKQYKRNGLDVTIECKKVTDLEKDTVDWAFNLTKSNMQSLYEESNWGWTEREKKEEMEHEKARYLVARDQDGCLQGFVHFRFDMDFDDEVVYCYEIQLMNDVRRKGLGKFMMQILELIALKTNMRKVMLTVFKNNSTAAEFFTKNLKFTIDETSPSIYDPMNQDDYDYEIMSKPIGQKKKAAPKSCCESSACEAAAH